jgi:hypothetical protein
MPILPTPRECGFHAFSEVVLQSHFTKTAREAHSLTGLDSCSAEVLLGPAAGFYGLCTVHARGRRYRKVWTVTG